MQEIYNKTADAVFKEMRADQAGLTAEEVAGRRREFGYNELHEAKRPGVLQVFFSQFADFLVLILLAAAAISFMLKDIKSTGVILAVTILNAILGTVQHIKAQKSLDSLKALSTPVARVLREGRKVEIPSREVVPGDLLFLEAGDFVSADGRIIENYSLQTNESSLTGESVSVIKTAEAIGEAEVPVGDRKNMVFAGSLITYGRAEVVVTGTGMRTELGKIATLLETAQEKKTPLQVSLDKFGKKLAAVIIVLCGAIFVLNVYRGFGTVESFMFAVALAVAAIPEALSSIVTIVLAIGTQKMARENAIVRKLQAVESLGSVSVICSDKTGTLTQNKMVVERLYAGGASFKADSINMTGGPQRKIVEMSVLCNDAVTHGKQEIGDPTEIALVNMAELYGVDEIALREKHPRLSELPFDSDRKLMSTLHVLDDQFTMVTKGAFDVIIERAAAIDTESGRKAITAEDIEEIKLVNREFSQQGLRVLAIACKTFAAREELTLEDEADLVFVGLVAMFDPPREESAQAVADCISAGITPVMITGDHKITAAAIARQIGMFKGNDRAVEGSEIDKLTDEELKSAVEGIAVYARVSPEHKIRIVRAWQARGNVVAMTGDGVNDAPALKQADIGIAMGRVGTEVAKDASAMVLTDDNFATIVKAVSHGRSIYTNIKNSIKFLLAGNTAGILAVLYTSIANLPLPFAAVHLLFINLLTDSLPAIALGLEPHSKRVMEEKPRNINEPILSRPFLTSVLFEGSVIAVCTVTAFYYGLNQGGVAMGSTLAFITLSLARLIHGFNCRSRRPLHKIGLFTNKYQWYALLTGLFMVALVITLEPMKRLFDVHDNVIDELAVVLGLVFVPLIVVQAYKSLREKLGKNGIILNVFGD